MSSWVQQIQEVKQFTNERHETSDVWLCLREVYIGTPVIP